MGITLLFVILLLIGILDVSAGDNALWPSGALCVLWLFIYAATIGPLAVRSCYYHLKKKLYLFISLVCHHFRNFICTA